MNPPALVAPMVALAAMARKTQSLSLSTMFPDGWGSTGIVVAMVAGALIVIVLAENSRIPVDDPTTHLELTMIHEVMVLDHSGPDLAFILYGAAVKLFVLSALLVRVALAVVGGAGSSPLVAGGTLVVAMVVVLTD